MDQNYVAVQAPLGDQYVELARSKQGRLFRKKILDMDSDFIHPSAPGKRIHVDRAFAEKMRANFKAGVCDTVQVPIVNDANTHVEDPLCNAGEVVDLTFDDKGVYALIDARKHADDFGKTLLGASALMHLDYPDTRSGEHMGPTLLHVAVTNRPYLTNLGEFEEVVAASADTSGETPVVLIPATEAEEKMTLDEMLAALRDEHGIDVEDLQRQARSASSQEELVAAMSNVLTSAGRSPAHDDDALTVSDVANAVIELAEEKVALSSQVDSLIAVNEQLAQREAEKEVDDLIKQGRILPKQRATMIALSRADRSAFESLLPDNPIVALSQTGVETFDAPEQSEQFKQDVERLARLANGTK